MMGSLWWALLIVTLAIQSVWTCPSSCSCKWKNGKQTVSCLNQDLEEIPDGLDAATQVLDFSGNKLHTLPAELFTVKHLVNLQRIFLSNCQITEITANTFKGLTNLVELDLSENLLDTVPTLMDVPSLMRLTLSSNPLKILKKFSFNHLSYLNTLELNGCQLVDIEVGAFQGLHSLEWLFLNGNRLKTIRTVLPQHLKGAEFQGNPWECDCHLQDFTLWLKTFNIPVSVEPTCWGPTRLVNRAIKSIAPEELACLPDVSPTMFFLELSEGKNVSLQCHVHSTPEAAISWWFRGQLLQNNSAPAPNFHLVYFLEDGAENKRSELFIYNANAEEDNGTFVCSAENAAGSSQANFTIKMIIKEDPIVIIVSFPLEYLLVAAIAAGVLALLIASVIIVSIVRCRRRRRRQLKRLHKADSEEAAKQEELPPKEQEVTLYAPPPLVLPSAAPLAHYPLEQNPDLINECLLPEVYGDVRWVDAGGYPTDYGLPKVANLYRTLPSRRPSAARMRYSQEAEFRTRYDHYQDDVRYTADGYPALSDGAPISLPCCSAQWPPCVNIVISNPNLLDAGKRCVSAQTEDVRSEGNGAPTESPDEGYEGEPSVV